MIGGLSNSSNNILNIPFGAAPIDTIVEWTIKKCNNDPLILSETTIFLPSRRSCREIKKIFLQKSSNKALLLPKIKAIGDVDYDELRLSASPINNMEKLDQIKIPTAPLRYRLLLIKEILNSRELGGFSVEAASNLAIELEYFLNEINKENLNISDLSKLSSNITEELSEYWQKSLGFLMEFDKRWQKILNNEGITSLPNYCNNMLLESAEFLRNNPSKYPIIAVASADIIPAASELLNVIAHLDNGYVFLHGVDRFMDEDCWNKIDEFHPQFTAKRLLKRIGCERENIKDIDDQLSSKVFMELKEVLYYATLPALLTDKWSELFFRRNSSLAQAFNNIRLIESQNTEEEAAIISLIIRDSLEDSKKKIVLITSDQNLSFRIRLNLQKWHIKTDNSVGIPLSQTRVASYFRLVWEVIESDFSPTKFLALLKHPFTCAGMESSFYHEMLNEFELRILRGIKSGSGLNWMYKKIEKLEKISKIKKGGEIYQWLSKIENILYPVSSLVKQANCEFKDLLKTHINCAEILANDDCIDGKDLLWNNQNTSNLCSLFTNSGGEEVYNFLLELWNQCNILGEIKTSQYLNLLDSLMSDKVYREFEDYHPRFHILTPMEARLLDYDLVIISGLNEGSFPKMCKSNPWINRSMCKEFGLPPAEEKIGIAAYDFISHLFSKEVIITRSLKENNIPTTKSRFLLRLEAIMDNLVIKFELENKYKELVKLLNYPNSYESLSRPFPKPKLQYRPQRFSATKIEKLIFDPYTIYALEILGLKKTDDLEKDFSSAEFGNFVHKVLEDFIRNYNDIPKDKKLSTLINVYGKKAYKEIFDEEECNKVIWWPRFENIAKWFVKKEEKLRDLGYQIFMEKTGELEIETNNTGYDCQQQKFIITAKADRIQFDKNRNAEIVDYKTGSVPGNKDVESGKSPQLSIEALILKEGGFIDKNFDMIDTQTVNALEYWKLSGTDRDQYGCENKRINNESKINNYIGVLTNEALMGLKKLMEWFNNEDNSYVASMESDIKNKDYEHLSRRKEWLYN